MPDKFNPLQAWQHAISGLPPGLPDNIIDAQREKFYDEVVAPWAVKQGFDPVDTKTEFLTKTARGGKVSNPRTGVAAATAAHTLLSPFTGDDGGLAGVKEAAIKEAQRQGVGTVLPEMAGQVAGELPYWIPAIRGAGALARGLSASRTATAGTRAAMAAQSAGTASVLSGESLAATEAAMAATKEKVLGDAVKFADRANRISQVAAGALVQGALDYSRTPNGSAPEGGLFNMITGEQAMFANDAKLEAGVKGALLGGALEAGMQFSGPLWRSLMRSDKTITETQAKAVEKLAKGIADETETKIATAAVISNPKLNDQLKGWIGQQVKAAKASGLPENLPEIEYRGRVKVVVKIQDRVFTVGGKEGLDPGEMTKAVDLLNRHLKSGASIVDIKGSPTAVNAFYRKLDAVKAPEETAPVVLKGQDETLQQKGKKGSKKAEDWLAQYANPASTEQEKNLAVLKLKEKHPELLLSYLKEPEKYADLIESRLKPAAAAAPAGTTTAPTQATAPGPTVDTDLLKTYVNEKLEVFTSDVSKQFNLSYSEAHLVLKKLADEGFVSAPNPAIKGKQPWKVQDIGEVKPLPMEPKKETRGRPPKTAEEKEAFKQQAAATDDLWEPFQAWAGQQEKLNPSLVQRQFKIGIGRAQRLIDRLKGEAPAPVTEPVISAPEPPLVTSMVMKDPQTTPIPADAEKISKLRFLSEQLQLKDRDTSELDMLIDAAEQNPDSLDLALAEGKRQLEILIKRQKGPTPDAPTPEPIISRPGETLPPVEAIKAAEAKLGPTAPDIVSGGAKIRTVDSTPDLAKQLEEFILDPGTDADVRLKAEIRLAELSPEIYKVVRGKLEGRLEGGFKKKAGHSTKAMKAEGPTKIPDEKLDPSSLLEVQPDGVKVKNKVTGKVYANMGFALKAQGLQVREAFDRSPRYSMDDPASRRDFLKKGAGAAASTAMPKVEAAQKAATSGSNSAFDYLLSQVKDSLKEVEMEDSKVMFTKDHMFTIVQKGEYKEIFSTRHLINDPYTPPMETLSEVARMMSDGKQLPNQLVEDLLTQAMDRPEVPIPLFGEYEDNMIKLMQKRLPWLKESDLNTLRDIQQDIGPAWEELSSLSPQSMVEAERSYVDHLKGLAQPNGRQRKALQKLEEKLHKLDTEDRYSGSGRASALQRTPLPLGEEGDAGVMMRFKQGEGGGQPAPAPYGTVDRPLAERTVLDRQGMTDFFGGNPSGAMVGDTGLKPQIYYVRDTLNRSTLWHENLHGHSAYLGIIPDIAQHFEDEMGDQLFSGAFSSKFVKAYKDTGAWGEELFTYMGQAVRTDDQQMIQAFVDADGSRAEVMTYFSDRVKKVLATVAEKPDSLHKRVMERKLLDVTRRAGSIADIERDVQRLGHELHYDGQSWEIYDPDTDSFIKFSNRHELANFIEKDYIEPQSSFELVDTSFMPEGMPRFAYQFPLSGGAGLPPIQTDVTTVSLPASGQIKAGAHASSFFFRPRDQWFESVARKNRWPELYATYREVVDAEAEMRKFTNFWDGKLREILGEENVRSLDKRKNLGAFRHTGSKPEAAQGLNLTDQDMLLSEKLTKELTDPLFGEFGIGNYADYVEEYLPRIRKNGWDPDRVMPSGRLSPTEVKFWAELNRTGQLDPRDNDVVRALSAYIHGGARKKFLEEPLSKLAQMNNLKTEEGSFVTGSLQPLIDRVIGHFRSRPDFTYNVINGFMNETLNHLNPVVEKVNKLLPQKLKIDGFEDDAGRELLGKWMLMMYSGSLGLRPMALLRDGMQLLLTTYPMLGGKYTVRGMKMLFSGKGKDSSIYQIPLRYGALVEHSPLSDLYSATGGVQGGKITSLAQASLEPMKWINNSNRIASFWGHQQRAIDAFTSIPEPKAAMKEAGAYWLPELLYEDFVKQLSVGADKTELSYRLAKELTDLSQWNYSRGASPGMYKYALGRLVGMYGTWPMSYIEYARTLATRGDVSDRVKATARLMAMHYTVLAAGQQSGVDTGTWVFTSPAAFGGSPIYNAAVSLPAAMDMETQKGTEARSDVIRPLFPMSIPGGVQMESVIKAISSDDEDAWKLILGFQPMRSGEAKTGLHQLVPDDDE